MSKSKDQLADWINLDDSSICLSALRTTGAIRVPHAISPAIAKNAFAVAQRLFKLTEEERSLCRRLGMSSGYTPPGIEGVKNKGGDYNRCF